MFRILYRFLSTVARLAVRSGRSKDLEIIVLRHQLQVLRRQTERPAVEDGDRALLGAIAAALPHRLRQGWIVTPETLLHWHRRRVARHWTQPSRPPGRPSTAAAIRSLALEMATDNLWGSEMCAWALTRADAPTLEPRVSHPLPIPQFLGPPRCSFWTLEGSRDHRAPPPAKRPSPPGFLDTYESGPVIQYNSVMRGYVSVPAELLADTTAIAEWLTKSYDWIGTLPPKATKKN